MCVLFGYCCVEVVMSFVVVIFLGRRIDERSVADVLREILFALALLDGGAIYESWRGLWFVKRLWSKLVSCELQLRECNKIVQLVL